MSPLDWVMGLGTAVLGVLSVASLVAVLVLATRVFDRER